ncbi:Alkyl sulfatase beta-lactamase family hydrolase protein [Cupriavidus taiwanensis]|uniref:alkyl/aryl-sulfatase n=1 Tax=Cupriavidus taiwanensis TaxID=164546 RepID=UPI000E13C312|nr:alkyl/aryl-sulfatase [Cupriavidus taiwanensis]SPA03025.1 Alkyl sulfatase beta-lactamase family hydrolase protein [Cupriavidus taiwanensis]
MATLVTATSLLASNSVVAHEGFAGRDKLRAHSAEFRKEIIRVVDGVYVAVGYSASNVTLIQGDGGSIIVDTANNITDAQEIVAAFGERLIRPVKAIVYTHGHPDHTGGAKVFAGKDHPAVYAHRLLVERGADKFRGTRDGGDAFGRSLPAAKFINAGVQMRVGAYTHEGFVPADHAFDGDHKSLTIAGVRVELLHTPGETDENVAVWLPDKRVLMPGDDFYAAFPNLSPIRGVPMRSPEPWIASLRKMATLQAEYLVPGHMRPVVGADNVSKALTDYREGIRSVYDQTITGIKEGFAPDDLVQRVKLPPSLASSPYLQEFYGGVEWTVRGIFAEKVGWFDGNATRLFPLTEKERATRLLALAGGEARLQSQVQAALASGDFQWAAELADALLAVNGGNVDAKRLKAHALTELGERQINANARNYYLTTAEYLVNSLPSRKAP